MKAIVVTVISLAVLIGVVVVEEGRISDLKKRIAALEKQPAELERGGGERSVAGPGRASTSIGTKGDRPRSVEEGGSVAAGDGKGDWAETFRKMMESPVGAAMIKEEHKTRAMRIYGGLIDSLNLSEEEREYFLGLVASGVGEEDAVGMKLFGAKTEEEAVGILDQMEADQEARRQAIKEFLNDDEDFASYEHFEARKEIYEQLPGLRAAMKETGSPITTDQEEQLVEAIYRASVDSGIDGEWKGRAGMEQFGEPGASERFQNQWRELQNALAGDVGTILENPAQQEAFQEHQKQVGNMAMIGIQFVEGMIAGQQGGGE